MTPFLPVASGRFAAPYPLHLLSAVRDFQLCDDFAGMGYSNW
jgi:hypothetical protein